MKKIDVYQEKVPCVDEDGKKTYYKGLTTRRTPVYVKTIMVDSIVEEYGADMAVIDGRHWALRDVKSVNSK